MPRPHDGTDHDKTDEHHGDLHRGREETVRDAGEDRTPPWGQQPEHADEHTERETGAHDGCHTADIHMVADEGELS